MKRPLPEPGFVKRVNFELPVFLASQIDSLEGLRARSVEADMRRKILSAFLRVSMLMAVTGVIQGEGSKQKAAAPLEKTEWKLIWLSGAKIESGTPQQMPYIQLDPESHRVSGSGGCNRLMGGYELAGDHLKFTQMAMTRMACIHGGDTESNFSKALGQVTQWRISKGNLLLMDADQHVVAKFSPYKPES